jgi:tetratricopeptide (TPR) repeat protein
VQRGCDLAQRGALFAAQTEFIQVIRRVAQANDAEHRTDGHSRALAEGLRALDEAADFVPNGSGLEGELDVAIAASSHRTPHVRIAPAGVAPHTAVAIYHSFAQERLAVAVGGQQAGSMALFGLGKVHARIAERRDDDVLSTRSAMTMYLAALAACPANHMAANELGVLLCRNGHPADAARMFEQAIDQSPSATAYHNLAVAQQKLGFAQQAAANQRESERLAAWERSTGAVSRRAGVQWVAAENFGQLAPPLAAAAGVEPALAPGAPIGQNAPMPMPYTAAPTPPKSPLQKAAALARSIARPEPTSATKPPATAPSRRPTIWQ